MNKQFTVIFVVLIALAGCAAMNDAMTPGMEVSTSDFDGSILVSQPMVGANRPSLSTDDSWNTLGFEWSSKTPDIVYLMAGVAMDITSVSEVGFIADGVMIEGIYVTDVLTTFKSGTYGTSSSRRFALPLGEFKKIATARIVKFKVVSNGRNSISRFGKDYPLVIVSGKLDLFVNEIESIRTQPD